MADDAHADEPKKTETLEIRLSPELKDALRETADAEGRTVSVVLRGLIDGYLAQARRTSPRSILWEIAMFFRHPVRLLAVAVGVLAISLTGFTSGQAQDMSLELHLSVWRGDAPEEPDGNPSHSSHELNTSVTATFGRPTSITLSASETKAIVLDVTPEAVDAESYLVRVELREVDGEASTVLASPVLQALFGRSAQISIDFDELNGYELVVHGEKLG